MVTRPIPVPANGSFFFHTSDVKLCCVAFARCPCVVLENNDMAAPPPTVFLSYRRHVSAFIARSIFMDLRQQRYFLRDCYREALCAMNLS